VTDFDFCRSKTLSLMLIESDDIDERVDNEDEEDDERTDDERVEDENELFFRFR